MGGGGGRRSCRRLPQRMAVRYGTFALALALAAPGLSVVPTIPLDPTPGQFRDESVTEGTTPSAAADWWSIFNDPELDRLIEAAHRANPALEQSLARVAEIRARKRIADAAKLPLVQAGGSVSRQTGPLINAAGGEGTLYTSNASFSYELDLFGRVAKASRAARRDLDAGEAQHKAARLIVEAEVVQTYFRIRCLDAEQALLARAADGYDESLRLSESNLAAGLIPPMQADLVRAEAADWRNDLLSVQRERAELEHALAVLTGAYASAFRLDPGAIPSLPPAIPAGLPSTMLQRRPDVQAATATVDAARARIGMAKASWFPTLSLTGTEGFAAPSLGDLFRNVAQTGGIGLLFNLPLFDGGRQAARVKGAEAEFQRASGQYRETILQAFREVEDQLVALHTLHDQAAVTEGAATAAARASARAGDMQKAGLISTLDRLETERRALRAERQAIRIRSERLVATVGLIRALGGGWGDAPGRQIASGMGNHQ